MKKVVILAILSIWSFVNVSQGQTTPPTYAYDYDGAGNQTRRWRIVLMQNVQKTDTTRFTPPPILEVNTKVYPNPTAGLLKVEIIGDSPNGKGDRINVRVTSLTGVTLINREEASHLFDIDLSNYPPGIYLVIISANDQITRLRVVKE